MFAININLKIKVKKEVSEYSLVSITVEKKKGKKPMHNTETCLIFCVQVF